MNFKRAILGMIILFGVLWSQAARKTTYRLFWADHFNGVNFNQRYWSKIPRGQSDWNRHMSNHRSLYQVRRGNLILWGRSNDGLDPKDSSPYMTGGLSTQGKVSLTYGKVEIRAKIQGAQGAWPAIWMLPEKGRWPDGGEIDIVERLNYDKIAYQTVHSYYTYILKQNNLKHGATGPIDPKGYNIYAVEILPDKLVFSINGKQTFTYPKIKTNKKGQFPFGTPFYLMIDMQLGGNWVGKVDPKQLPTKMEIDWVKFYKPFPTLK